ncbi:MAG: histidine phosphatase family protein [Henriciella sp.]|nr:histidine phosphatase family protein [Henriciella sp.]
MIFLVRHGEAAASWGEHPDPGLSDKGAAQAKQVAQNLHRESISSIISSPMQRCQDTAAAFCDVSGLALNTHLNVSEIPTPGGIKDRVSWLRTLMGGTWTEAPPVVQDWRTNLIETVEALPDQTVVFSHFVAINALVGHLEGSTNVTVFRPTHCSVTRLKRDENGLNLVQRGSEATTQIL